MESYTALNQPGVGLIAMIVIGLLAGWIAEKVTSSDHGLLTNLVVGIAGSFVGGKIAEVLEIPVFGFFRTLVAAAIGAVLLLWIWRLLRGRAGVG
ncbi:MAG: GlsB/YeaQ/YmgE family stress response membrane protein [Bradyrhizobiaceae bacterium]|nr:GlsB/YeaQ/YmgE family stress response membrane protein [Bradyrhizobiaceae bacterium]